MRCDVDPVLSGTRVAGHEVRDAGRLAQDLEDRRVDIAIVTVPAVAAQEADDLVEADTRAILGYAPTSLRVPEGVELREVDPVLQLQSMTYYLRYRQAPSA